MDWKEFFMGVTIARLHFSVLYFIMGFSLCLWLTCSTLASADMTVTQQNTVHGSQENASVTTCLAGNGKEVTERRSLADFSKIKIDGAFTVSIDIQLQENVIVTGDENLLSRYTTTVQDGLLVISSRGVMCPRIPPKIRVTNDTLATLLADGSADISISGLDNRTFAVQLDGASELQLSGKSQKFTSRLRGSHTLRAEGFQAQEMKVTIDGTGEAWVHAENKLVAEIKGAGHILFAGNPHTIEQRIYGTGTIRPQ